MAKHPEIPNLVVYPESAPFGALQLLRHDHAVEGPYSYRAIFHGIDAAQLVRESWVESDWFTNATNGDAAGLLVRHDHRARQFDKRIAGDLIHAAHSQGSKIGWLALRRPPETAPWRPDRVVGVSLAEQHVDGNVIGRSLARHLHPERAHAQVTSVTVGYADRGKGIGAALLDATLACFPDDMVPTTRVLGANDSLLDKLGELGFYETGVQEHTDILPGDIPIEITHMRAHSVESVREHLADQFPWLAMAETYINTLDN